MTVARDQLELLMELLATMDPAPTSWEDVDTGEAWVETYDADRVAVENRAREMADIATSLDGRIHAATIEAVESADWTEAWKRFFHTTRVSPRIVVHPSWEPCDAAPGDIVVDIDPGMSFGTGLHPTTRTCLRFLDSLSASTPHLADEHVVDLGCGSGILAIAAAKLGYAGVTALDNDPLAVRVTRENLLLNTIAEECVTTATADVLHDPLPVGDLVVANILASVLVEAAPRIAAAVRQGPHAALVLSGILDSQFADVQRAFSSVGFELQESELDGDWRTGCFRRRSGKTPAREGSA
jgi:ribosomal protein L11 methyltransferase